MKIINLREHYPYYIEDCYIQVSDELASILQSYKNKEKAFKEKVRYHKAYYSLDYGGKLECSIASTNHSPETTLEIELMRSEIHSAINTLSDTQARRIYARYWGKMTQSDIAKVEGVNKSSVSKSIKRGLAKLKGALSQET